MKTYLIMLKQAAIFRNNVILPINDVTEVLGSDGTMRLDGRLSLESMVEVGRITLVSMQKTRSDVIGFKIETGESLLKTGLVYEEYTLPNTTKIIKTYS